MSLLNRPAEYANLYDSEGRLQGGLTALEELAAVIAMNNSNDRELADALDSDDESDDTPARDSFPIRTQTQDSPSLDSDDEMIGSGDEDMEEISMYDEPRGIEILSSTTDISLSPSSGTPVSLSPSPFTPSPLSVNSDTASIESNGSGGTAGPGSSPSATERPHRRMSARSIGSRMSSRRSSRRRQTLDRSIEVKLPIGEQLKKQFLEMGLFSTLLVSRSHYVLIGMCCADLVFVVGPVLRVPLE